MERTDVLDGQDVGIDGGAASAEEAAVHVVDLDADPDADGGEPSADDAVIAETLAADPDARRGPGGRRAGPAGDGRGFVIVERDIAADPAC